MSLFKKEIKEDDSSSNNIKDLTENPQVNLVKLPILKHFCMTIGNLPTTYFESMTYLEMVMWLCNYLEKTVIPTINNNAEAVTELQELYKELNNYVTNYFNNLDVQDEIDNKLDEMVQNGTLEMILNNYTNLIKCYNTYTEMIEDISKLETLTTNFKCKTLGYHEINDGGSAYYYISNDDSINGYKTKLSNDIYVILLINDIINVKCFGAYGDSENDDTISIQNAINYIDTLTTTYQQIVPSNPSWLRYHASSPTLYFPYGKYLVNETLNFQNSRFYNIEGNNSFINSTSSLDVFKFSGIGGTRTNIKNLVFNNNYNSIHFDSDNIDSSMVNIENCKFLGNRNIAINYTNRSSMLSIKNCLFSWCYKILVNNMCDNVHFENCWFAEYESNENNYTSFIFLWGENKFTNCLFIPNGGYDPNINQNNFNNLAWIQAGDNQNPQVNNPSVILDKCRVSSERNSKTLINWKVIPNSITNVSDTSIKILNCYHLSASIGDAIIKLWHLPQQLIIENSDLRIEDNTFISLDESLDIETEINTYVTSPNRLQYTYDYSILNNKTQSINAYKKIPPKLMGLFRNIDKDIEYTITSTSPSISIPLGMQSLGNTNSFHRMFLVKAYFNPINTTTGLSSITGILMFNAVNAQVSGSASIRVDFQKIAQSSGGSQLTSEKEINIIPTFQNGENHITMTGMENININLTLENSTFDNVNSNYITMKEI